MDPGKQHYADLTYMAEQLGLPVETLRTYHKRAVYGRKKGLSATTWRMPAPDAPADVQSRGHPRWLRETADDYIAAKRGPRLDVTNASESAAKDLHDKRARAGQLGGLKRWENQRNKRSHGTSGGIELTDEVVEQLADEAERGYDLSQLGERERRDLADEHRDQAAEGPVMVRLSSAERNLASEALSSVTPAGLGLRHLVTDGPRGWSAAMALDRADEIAAALMKAWREHDQPVYELAVRFAEDRVPARRTKRGGWAAGVRTGDRTE